MRTSAMCRMPSSCLQGCPPLLVPCCSTFGSEVSADIALLSSCAQRDHGGERLEQLKRLVPTDKQQQKQRVCEECLFLRRVYLICFLFTLEGTQRGAMVGVLPQQLFVKG